jgi:hypothetical protein
VGINVSKFLNELAAAGLPVLGLRPIGRDGIIAEDVMFDFAPQATAAERSLAEQLKVAHDPTDYDAIVQAAAKAQAAAIPNWATWTAEQALTWHDANVKAPIDAATTLAQAKAAMQKLEAENRALIQMIVAMRNQLWPGLQNQ